LLRTESVQALFKGYEYKIIQKEPKLKPQKEKKKPYLASYLQDKTSDYKSRMAK